MIIHIYTNPQDIASERDCFGVFDKIHDFCQSICCVRWECERKSRKVK